jgi:hypothetical protein
MYLELLIIKLYNFSSQVYMDLAFIKFQQHVCLNIASYSDQIILVRVRQYGQQAFY